MQSPLGMWGWYSCIKAGTGSHGDIPRSIRRGLKPRRTNIIAYEMIAAVAAIFMLDKIVPGQVCIRHFVDNTTAKTCIVSGHSKQEDLNNIVGLLWHTAAHRTLEYWNEWVQSQANLADAPSRRDCKLLKQLQSTEIKLNFRQYLQVAESWQSDQRADKLMRPA